jgi:hypothetical protein
MQRAKAIGQGKLFDVCDCYVLDGGTRVLSKRGLVALLSNGAETTNLDRFLERLPSEYAHLAAWPNFAFNLPQGRVGQAVEVDAVIAICIAYDELDDADQLRANQRHLARGARRLLRAAAKVGLTALVDEATGYDAVRQRGDLAKLFRDSLGAWEETFTPALVRELCRLGLAGEKNIGWTSGRYPRPLAAAFRHIYELLIGVEAARRLKEINSEPRFNRNHHQWLTEEARDLLKKNMGIVTFCARTSTSRADFWHRLDGHYRGQASLVYHQ